MSYVSTGLQALFPVYLARLAETETPREEYNISVAQNEANLNQNLEILFQKLGEIETYLSEPGAGGTNEPTTTE